MTAPGKRSRGNPALDVPILGQVAAGTPLLAMENIEGMIPVCAEWAKGEEVFFLRVGGESMVPTLWEGDYLLVRRQATVENEAIAVALIEGEVVVKRVSRIGHFLTLKPDNDAFPLLTVNLQQQSVQIVGKAVGVYRKL